MHLPSRPLRAGLIAAAAAVLAACGGDSGVTGVKPDTTHTTQIDTMPLRYYAQLKGRYIGTAAGSMLSMPGDSGVKLRSIAAREFSMLWTGTYMKMDQLRPNRATFNYTTADALLAWAQQNGMVMRGHTLVWHSQVPAWVTSSG
ncbi:MAG TPA: endo-1,4-beta-xylanase, partial [Longimicrobiales bacterium]